MIQPVAMRSDKDVNTIIEETVKDIENNIDVIGIVVKPRKMMTKELMGINLQMYINQNAKVNQAIIDEDEKIQYKHISDELNEKSELFKRDRDTRQVIFTSDKWCPSMIHLLIRGDALYVTSVFRSVDIRKLRSDLTFLAELALNISKKVEVRNAVVDTFIISLHKYIEKDERGIGYS